MRTDIRCEAGAGNAEAPRILVVDDDGTSRAVVARRLANMGIETAQATNGAEAFRMLMEDAFDLVILDLEMPELDGLGLLGIIRCHPRLRHLPVLVATSDESRHAIEQALAAGATSFLIKPLNWSAFGPHIRHLAELVHTSRVALENMAQGLALYDKLGNVVLSNTLYSEMIESVEPRTAAAPVAESASTPRWLADCRSKLAGGQVELMTELDDGRYIASTLRRVSDGGWLEVHRDVSEQRMADARINYLARHDSLTGLANRAEFNERIEHEIARVRRGEEIALLCMDLDYFKTVNDTLGHPVGDRLLKEVAGRLLRSVRETDSVARLGGDEFVIIQVASEQPSAAGVLASRLIDVMSQPFEIDGHSVVIGASIGIAIAPTDSLEPDTLLRMADLALYRAKEHGRKTFCYFEAEMDIAMQARRQMELDLRSAITCGELELNYQPLVSIDNGEVNGFEALMRWNHPKSGRIPPDVFIPLAEEIGLISEIGNWALYQACQDAARWPGNINVAVNVSPCQFASRELIDAVRHALEASRLEPKRLQLEITETVLLKQSDLTLAILFELRELGVKIVMDDFGTGYSSLNYLRKFPFHKLKIDKAFIDGIGADKEASAIVTAITDLARTLGIRTTAEGVESADQRSLLASMGCDEIQGYLISRPVPNADVSRLMAHNDGTSRAA